jgi:predicted TIM-barrel fold metal-dependent hydrolase
MRADCHIHLDKIGGPHKTVPPSVEMFTTYAQQEGISLFFVIYEKDETLVRFQATGYDMVPIYWERRPLAPNIPTSARAVKLHPYIERYQLTRANVEPALEEAKAKNLFVFIHTEDREPELSRGRLVAELAQAYPELLFVMAHSGSYAPPNVDDPGSVLIQDGCVCELVSEAVEVARRYDNIYLETSILASDTKAKILAKAPVSKLLIGSDFPILAETHWSSLRFQEKQLLRFGLSEGDIDRIHQNASQLVNTFQIKRV